MASAHASDGRDFFASFSVTTPTPVDATHTSLTLTLDLHNMSGSDVVNASILLMDPIVWTKQIAELTTNVNVRDRGSTNASGVITVDTSEYQRWLAGGAPNLFVQYTTTAGVTLNRPIESTRMPDAGATP